MKLDGSERIQLSYTPSLALLPRWSPDGMEIVFFATSQPEYLRSRPTVQRPGCLAADNAREDSARLYVASGQKGATSKGVGLWLKSTEEISPGEQIMPGCPALADAPSQPK
jgi:hypothetical protein